MKTIQQFLARPGVQASEFKVAMGLLAWLGVNADQHWVSTTVAAIISSPGFAYIISRGLAKTEVITRTTS